MPAYDAKSLLPCHYASKSAAWCKDCPWQAAKQPLLLDALVCQNMGLGTQQSLELSACISTIRSSNDCNEHFTPPSSCEAVSLKSVDYRDGTLTLCASGVSCAVSWLSA